MCVNWIKLDCIASFSEGAGFPDPEKEEIFFGGELKLRIKSKISHMRQAFHC